MDLFLKGYRIPLHPFLAILTPPLSSSPSITPFLKVGRTAKGDVGGSTPYIYIFYKKVLQTRAPSLDSELAVPDLKKMKISIMMGKPKGRIQPPE